MIRVCFRYGDHRAFARLVCAWRGGDSAHCEVAFDWRAQAHDCVSASWLDGGVRIKTIDLPADKWRIYEMPADRNRALAWAAQHAGERYDTLGLLGFVMRRIKGWRRAWFCSEVAADVMYLPEPYLYDLRALESVCGRYGTRVQ